MFGLPTGVMYGQNERVDELNDRVQDRQFSDKILKPNLEFRPVPTKYALFPILDRRTPSEVPIKNYSDYNIATTFYPGNSQAPISGFIQNVDTETILRNQCFALQHSSDQRTYVPKSTSDLYHVPKAVGRQEQQPHAKLFEIPSFDNRLHPNMVNAPSIGGDLFNNNTRTQLRNM